MSLRAALPPVHPAANALRMMDEDELEGLAELIEANGLRDPITVGVLDGERFVVDGRNRMKACEIAGVEPRFREKTFADEDELRAFVFSRNSVRRSITKGQQAMAHALLFPEAAKLKRKSDVSSQNTFSKALLSKARAVLAYSRPTALRVRDGFPLNEAYEQVKADQERVERSRRKHAEIRANLPDILELELPFDEVVAAYEQRKAETLSLIERGRRAIASFATISASVEDVRTALALSREWKALPTKITAAEAGSIDLTDFEAQAAAICNVVEAFTSEREFGLMSAAERERAAIRAAWPDEFRDGARCGLSQKYEGPREAGGYPMNFNSWPIDRRNSWWSGFNAGRLDRLRHEAERARG